MNRLLLALLAACHALAAAPPAVSAAPGPDDTRQIAEEAFVYGLPMVMNYAVFYEYFVNEGGPDYKAPIGTLHNTARVYTPADTAVVTPNSDTPYSFVAMDLRAEPFVLCNPAIDPARYFSIQLVDFYTFNFGYMGSRTTGNGAGCFAVAGPGWTGDTPAGIRKVIRSETDFALAIVRTQLFDPGDLDNVKKIQAGYRALPLSAFLERPAPPAAPAVSWPRIDKQLAQSDPFAFLNFVLQFCPPTGPAAVETAMRARFATIGVAAGKPFSTQGMSDEQRAALAAGMRAGTEAIEKTLASMGTVRNGWRVVTQGFGDREAYDGNWALRAAAAKAGIYGNDAAEALYPMLVADGGGQPLDTGTNRYTLTFPPGQLPPANAFWSVTMYDGKTQLLIENPIDRYLINSPMLPGLRKDPDGSITLHLRKDSPGKDLESNWLPAPNGPPYVVMRIYWPKQEALDGRWSPPAVRRAE